MEATSLVTKALFTSGQCSEVFHSDWHNISIQSHGDPANVLVAMLELKEDLLARKA